MTRRSKKILYLILAIAVAVIAYRVVQSKPTRGKVKERPSNAAVVEVEKVKLGTIQQSLSLTGNINPDAQVTIYSEVPGTVERITVEEGDTVKKGQLIAEIDTNKYELQLRQAEAALAIAKVNEENMAKEYKRAQELKAGNLISQQQMDTVEAQYKAAQAQLAQAQAALELARENYDSCKIKSPIDGVIAKKFIDGGELIVAAAKPIVTIMNIDKVKIVIHITEKFFSSVKPGLEAVITVDAYPDREFKGAISKVGSVIDPTSRTVEAEVAIVNDGYLLRPGMFARVEVTLGQKSGIPVIQRDYALEDLKGSYVYVLDGDVARKRYIQPGIINNNLMEVVEGLSEGETIVSFGQQRLRDGDKVTVSERGGQP